MNAILTSTMRETGIIRRLYGLMLPYRRTVATGLMFLLLSVAAELYPPLVWQRVVDIGLAHGDWAYIW
jgi:ABC-type multidrug transport system fused ATPase/permease subunit